MQKQHNPMIAINNDKDFLSRITIEPLNKANWTKFVQLFGDKGACANCWCMFYRLGKADFKEGKKNGGNKEAMRNLVMNKKPNRNPWLL